MAPAIKKWIDKKSSTTFQVRYRSQKDPLIHDETATDFVLANVDTPNSKSSIASFSPYKLANEKIKTAHDLESELGIDASKIRSNEGEAAIHGVYFDDTKYDYMQHLRDIGISSEAVLIEAQQTNTKQPGKGKHKQSFSHANLRQKKDLALKPTVIQLPKELLPSEVELKRTFQDQMDVPDAIKGFQPDMDPHLREVLEALEDDAYVDDNEDIFGELAKGGEASEGEFKNFWDEDEDDGWESDATERWTQSKTSASNGSNNKIEKADKDLTMGDWMKEFSKYKKEQKVGMEDTDLLVDIMSFDGASIMTGGAMSISKRRRRREKNAVPGTVTSGYSISSSALSRTEGLALLDDRFDKIEEEYGISNEGDNPDGPMEEVRQDLNEIMDEFLENYNVTGSKVKHIRVRRGKYQTGLEQLDEVRRELGNIKISKGMPKPEATAKA